MAIYYNLHRFGVNEFAVGHLIMGWIYLRHWRRSNWRAWLRSASICVDYFFNHQSELLILGQELNACLGSSLASQEADPEELFCRWAWS